MSTTSGMLLGARVAIVDRTGIPTKEFYQFLVNLFNAIGGYQAPGSGGGSNLMTMSTNAEILASTEFGASGPDYDAAIRGLEMMIASEADTSGRIAQLEARIQALEMMVAQMPAPVDLEPIRLTTNALLALELGS